MNYAFCYVAMESMISAENVARLERIMELPIDQVESSAIDDLYEGFEASPLPTENVLSARKQYR